MVHAKFHAYGFITTSIIDIEYFTNIHTSTFSNMEIRIIFYFLKIIQLHQGLIIKEKVSLKPKL
jgi:hypothetical protein